MKKLFKLFIVMLAVCGISCEQLGGIFGGGNQGGDEPNSPNNPSNPGTTEAVFNITVTDITSSGAYVAVETTSNETYYFDVIEKEYLDQYTDKKVFAAEMVAEIKAYYEEVGYTLADALSYGSDGYLYEEGCFDPNTEYYAYAVAVTENGVVNSDLTLKQFKTLVDNGEPSSNTFSISVTDITSSTATVSVTPSNSDTYYFDVFKKADYDQYGGDSQFLEYWQADIKSYIEELNNQGYNITIANFVSSGNDMFAYEGNYALEPNTEYYAFAFGLSTGGRITTDVTKKAFKTLAVSEGGDKCIDNLVWGRVTGYGDEYSVGAKNWVIVLYDETRTSEFDIELQTELSATELPLGEYPINSTMSAGTAIAGADDEGYYGTFWKNSVETVFCKSGTVVLGKEGDNYTIRVEALDGNGNAITMSYTGELEKIAYDF